MICEGYARGRQLMGRLGSLSKQQLSDKEHVREHRKIVRALEREQQRLKSRRKEPGQ